VPAVTQAWQALVQRCTQPAVAARPLFVELGQALGALSS
jgi:hypothetical protein